MKNQKDFCGGSYVHIYDAKDMLYVHTNRTISGIDGITSIVRSW